MFKLLTFLFIFLFNIAAFAIPITSPDGTPVDVTVKNELRTRAVTSGSALSASIDGDAFIFPSNFITLTAGAGEEAVIFIQNKSQTKIFQIGVIFVVTTDAAAKLRTYLNVTTDNAVTTGSPTNINATSTKLFDGVFRFLDGTDTAGIIGGALGSQSFNPLIFDTGGTVLLGFNDSLTVTVDSSAGADVSAVIVGNYFQ